MSDFANDDSDDEGFAEVELVEMSDVQSATNTGHKKGGLSMQTQNPQQQGFDSAVPGSYGHIGRASNATKPRASSAAENDEEGDHDERLTKMKLAQCVAYCPSMVMLLCLLFPLAAGALLFVPTYQLPAIDTSYTQFQVESHPTTTHEAIHAAISGYNTVNMPPDATAWDYLFQAVENLFGVEDDHFPTHNTLRVLEENSNFIGPERKPLQTAGERTLHSSKQLLLIYTATKEDTNLLQSDYISRIRQVEENVQTYPGYADHCVLSETSGECLPLTSCINYFYPSIVNGQIYFDGGGGEQGNIDDIVDIFVSEGLFDFFDLQFNSVNRETVYIVTLVKFGLPLPGFADFWDRQSEQRDIIVEFIDGMEEFLAKQTNKDLYVIYSGGNLIDNQVNAAIWSDVTLALGSVAFIFLYAYIHTSSLFLTIFGLLGVVMSFPGTILAHVWFFGPQMSFLNGISLWIILGIGADDMFVFVDIWKQNAQVDVNGNKVPNHLKLAATYRKAGAAMLATSFTTSVAFFGSMVSEIGPIREFGFFMGCIVTINYMLVMTWFPAVLMMHVKYIQPIANRCCHVCHGREADEDELDMPDALQKESSNNLSSMDFVRQLSSQENVSQDNVHIRSASHARRASMLKEVSWMERIDEDEGGDEAGSSSVDKKAAFNREKSVHAKAAVPAEAKCMLVFFKYLYILRWPVIIVTIGFVIGMMSIVPDLQPPEDLPQFLPSDHNVELLRASEGSLSSAASTTSTTAANDNTWSSGATSTGSTGDTTVVTTDDTTTTSSGSSSSTADDCPVLVNNVCFPLAVASSSSVAALSVPSAPINVRAVALDSDSIEISWDQPSERTDELAGYSVVLSDDAEASWDTNLFPILDVVDFDARPSIVWSSLRPEQEYHVRVVAYEDDTGTNVYGILSDSNSTTTLQEAPDAVTSLQQITSGSQGSDFVVNLGWVEPEYYGPGVTELSYLIERDGSTISEDEVFTPTVLYADYDVCGDQTYTYEVTAVSADYGPSATVQVVITTDAAEPKAPTLDAVDIFSPVELSLTVTAPICDNGATITGYGIELSTDGGSTWASAVNVDSDLSGYKTVDVLESTTYDVRIYATNSFGNGVPSEIITITTPQASPDQPVGMASAINATHMLVNWTVVDEGFDAVDTVRLQWFDTISWVTLYDGPGTGTDEYIVGGLIKVTTYTFRVRVWNSYDNSDWSDNFDGTTDPDPPGDVDFILTRRRLLGVVDVDDQEEENDMELMNVNIGRRLLASTPLSDTVYSPRPTQSLSWSEPDNGGGIILGYQVQLHDITLDENDFIIAYDGPDTSCTIDVTYGKHFTVALRAKNEGGWGDWSNATALPVQKFRPEPPVVTVGIVDAVSVEFLWETPHDNGYTITSYEAVITHDDLTQETVVLSNATNNLVVAGQVPENTVSVVITSVNADGVSDDSVQAEATTDTGPLLTLFENDGTTAIDTTWAFTTSIEPEAQPFSFWLRNSGSATMTVSSIAITAGASWLSLTFDLPEFTLASGEQLSVALEGVVDDTVGSFDATVRITHDGVLAVDGYDDMNIIITGVAADILLSAVTADGQVARTSLAANLVTIQVDNTGTADLEITGVTYGGASWVTVSPATTTVTAAGQQDLIFTFQAGSLAGGDYATTVTIEHSLLVGGESSTDIACTLHVVDRDLQFNNSFIGFTKSQSYPATSMHFVQGLTADVSGNEDCELTSIALTGDLAGLESLVHPASVPDTILLGNELSSRIQVDLSSLQGGVYSGEVVYTHNSPLTGSTTEVPYEVTITAPGYSPSVESVTGTAKVGATTLVTRYIVITNVGTDTLTLTAVVVSASSIFTLSDSSKTVAAGAEFTLSVFMDPTGLAKNDYVNTVRITHDGPTPGQVDDVPVTLTMQQAVVSLDVTSSDVTVDYDTGASATTTTTVDISNDGDFELVVSNVAATSGAFVTPTFTTAFSVAVGATKTVTLTWDYDALAAGANADTITFTHDGVGGSDAEIVTITVNDAPVIVVDEAANAISETYIVGDDTFVACSVSITNDGSDILTMGTVSIGGDLSGGSISVVSSANIGASNTVGWQFELYLPGGTGAGTYTGTLTLTHNDASRASVAIDYTVSVFSSSFVLEPLQAEEFVLWGDDPFTHTVDLINEGTSSLEIDAISHHTTTLLTTHT